MPDYYQEQLNTEEWLKFSLALKEKKGYKCEGCGAQSFRYEMIQVAKDDNDDPIYWFCKQNAPFDLYEISAGWTCRLEFVGGFHDTSLQVHHKKYIAGRLPWQYEEHDLQVLCDLCHKKAENIPIKVKPTINYHEMWTRLNPHYVNPYWVDNFEILETEKLTARFRTNFPEPVRGDKRKQRLIHEVEFSNSIFTPESYYFSFFQPVEVTDFEAWFKKHVQGGYSDINEPFPGGIRVFNFPKHKTRLFNPPKVIYGCQTYIFLGNNHEAAFNNYLNRVSSADIIR